jgi:flap endonuclease-1
VANVLLQVYAAGSEDMDTLTFGTPILLKHLTFSEAKKMPVHEVNLKKALEGLEMDMNQVSERARYRRSRTFC